MSAFSASPGGHGAEEAREINKSETAREQQLKEAREKNRKSKDEDRKRLKTLPLGGLYVLLFLREDNLYHWGLYLHKSGYGGCKYHITGRDLGNSAPIWLAEHGIVEGPFRSSFLVVVIQIGTVPANRLNECDSIIRSLDNNLNQPGMNCFTWVLRIMALLKQAGLIHYDDVEGVKSEIMGYGHQYRESARLAERPRPLLVSQKCH